MGRRHKLISLRKKRNLLQKDIINILKHDYNVHISESYYGMIEQGNRTPKLHIALAIADIFDVDPQDIFFKKGNNILLCSFEEVAAVVDQAKQNGVHVACHAESNTAIKKASKAGVRTIEHGIYLDDEAVEMMLKNKIFLVPTLAMYWGFLRKGPDMGIPQAVIDGHKRTHESHVQSIHMAMDAGISIVAGSDAGLVHFPQGGVRDEIVSFVEIGMQPMDAIKTATLNAAKCLDIEDTVGTLEAGKQADILILNQNPLVNISSIKDNSHLVSVIKKGEILS